MSQNTDPQNGLIETFGPNTTAAEAADRLEAAIGASDGANVVARVDHSAGAHKVGLELTPTIEVLFGNPTGGTPLMYINPTVAIDLPQKVLIIETPEGVRVFHNDPLYLANRHGIPADTAEIQAFVGGLQKLANVAAGI